MTESASEPATEKEAQVYRSRLNDALAVAPRPPPVERIAARVRHETSVRDLMGFGFSHLVMTLLVFFSRTYRVLPEKVQEKRADVESAPAND